PSQVQVVIDTLKLLKTELNVLTVAGISNISYGLPNRSLLDRTFLTSCVIAGLDAPIINPLSESLMETVSTIKLFSNQDKNAQQYVKRHQGSKISNNRLKEERILLKELIVQGREEESVIEVNNLL